MNRAAEQAVEAAESANRVIANLEGPVSDFAASGLPQLEEAIRGLDEATRSLEDLVEEVRTSPREFISRPSSNELEVQP